MENQIPQILSMVSIVIGIILIITSSLVLDDWRKFYKAAQCKNNIFLGEVCDWMKVYLAAGSLGIICGLLQIGSGALGWLKKWTIWCGIHAFSFLAMLIAFSMALDKNLNDWIGKEGDKGKAFLAFAGIDWIFCLGATIGVFFLTKNAQ